jgi:hypothetical protein
MGFFIVRVATFPQLSRIDTLSINKTRQKMKLLFTFTKTVLLVTVWLPAFSQVDFSKSRSGQELIIDASADVDYEVELTLSPTPVAAALTFTVEDTRRGSGTASDYTFTNATVPLPLGFTLSKLAVPVKVLKSAKAGATIILRIAISGVVHGPILHVIALKKREDASFPSVIFEPKDFKSAKRHPRIYEPEFIVNPGLEKITTFTIESTAQGTATTADFSMSSQTITVSPAKEPQIFTIPVKINAGATDGATIVFKVNANGVNGELFRTVALTKDITKRKDYVMINLTKSIVGDAPSGEFSEVAAKLSYGRYLYGFYSFDINLSNKDTARRDLALLNQAFVSLNVPLLTSSDAKRHLFAMPLVKVFNYEPYYGFGLGSFEFNPSSKLYTTYFYASYLHSFFSQKLTASANYTGDNIFFHHNVYMEFAVKLSKETNAGFLTNARLKGGVLIPLNLDHYSILNTEIFPNFPDKESSDFIRVRIALQVPVGDIISIR